MKFVHLFINSRVSRKAIRSSSWNERKKKLENKEVKSGFIYGRNIYINIYIYIYNIIL